MQRLIFITLLVTLCAAPAASGRSIEEEAEIAERKLVAMLRTMRPNPEARRQREKLVALLQEVGYVSLPTGRALYARRTEQHRLVYRLFSPTRVPLFVELVRPKLLEARTAAQAAIFNRKHYPALENEREAVMQTTIGADQPRDAPTSKAQDLVDRKVKALQAIWRNPLPVVLEKEPRLMQAVEALEEIDEYLRRLGVMDEEERFQRTELAARVGREIRAALTPEKDLEIMAWNAAHAGHLLSVEAECLKAINGYRLMMGLPTLELDLRLLLAGRLHNAEMREKRYFSHISPTPAVSTPRKRAVIEGFVSTDKSRELEVGENLAMGPQTATGIFSVWYRSPAHHRNMLSDDWWTAAVAYLERGERDAALSTMMFGNIAGYAHSPRRPPRYQYLRHALQRQSWSPSKHFRLALYCYQHGLARYMVWECRRTLALSPDHRGARRLLGQELSLEGDWVQARE